MLTVPWASCHRTWSGCRDAGEVLCTAPCHASGRESACACVCVCVGGVNNLGGSEQARVDITLEELSKSVGNRRRVRECLGSWRRRVLFRRHRQDYATYTHADINHLPRDGVEPQLPSGDGDVADSPHVPRWWHPTAVRHRRPPSSPSLPLLRASLRY